MFGIGGVFLNYSIESQDCKRSSPGPGLSCAQRLCIPPPVSMLILISSLH